jgi:hypothetical protein
MKIQILFLHKRDLLGRIIQFLSKGEQTHCGIVVNDFLLADTNFGRRFGIRFIPWRRDDYELIELKLTSIQYENAINWIHLHEGTPYDNLNNILWLLGKKSNGTIKLNCTESVISFLCDIGFLNHAFRNYNLSPTQLYTLLESRC